MRKIVFGLIVVLAFGSQAFAKEVTSENFEQEVLKASKPVLVEFYREGCGWCEKSKPVVAEFEKTNLVATIDITKETKLAELLSVPPSTPFYLKFENGKEVGRWSGYSDLKTLAERFDDPSKAPKPRAQAQPDIVQLQARAYQLIKALQETEILIQQLQQPEKAQ